MKFCSFINKEGYKYQWKIIGDIRKNTSEFKAFGFERVLKLILVFSKLIFPAFHIGVYFEKKGQIAKNNSIEFYVFFKLVMSIVILYYHLFEYWEFDFWIIYMTTETLLYPATLIFCSDFFPKPTSFKRDIIFVFIDYTMVVIDFASLYLLTKTLCNSHDIQITRSLDALYFSFVSAFTIGYGDITVTTDIGKYLVIFQALIFLTYGVLFLNFYASRIGENNKSND